MTDYTVIVDDSDERITYAGSWDIDSTHNHVYNGSTHMTQSSNASLSLPFHGGHKVIVRGGFTGNNDASNTATYPIFQVDSQNLNCAPNTPQNGGQFLCSLSLPSKTDDHTLSMFLPPNARQQFHIDYIRYGSSFQGAQLDKKQVVFMQSPNGNTTGLTLNGNWQKDNSLGSQSSVGSAMKVSEVNAQATFKFVGSSIAWWGCCMPPGTSDNTANGTYSIDGGDSVPFQVDDHFMQGRKCNSEKVLFSRSGMQEGNHTLLVTYQGDSTKMPLTLCALAGVPLDFNTLDVSDPQPMASGTTKSNHGKDSSSGNSTGIIIGVITGIVFAFLSVFIVVYVLRRKRARDVESRISFNAPRLAIRRVVPSVDLADHDPPTRRTSIDKESILEAPPPFYRSSMAKSRFSWRSLSFRAQPHQQTAYVGSDYGNSVASFNPRDSTQSYYHSNYLQPEPPRYNRSNRGSKSRDPDPVLPLP